MSHFMNELTGYEDMELHAMRLEAEREAAMEASMAEYADEVGQAEYEAQQANPMTAVCAWQSPWDTGCSSVYGDDDIPF